MKDSAHQAAIDQARLLAAYLAETPSESLDMRFIRCHLDALNDFACVANRESVASTRASMVSTQSTAPARPTPA